MHYDPESDTVLQKQKGPDGSVHWKRLSQGDFKALVEGLEPRDSGISAATLSRALITSGRLEGHDRGRDSSKHRPATQPDGGREISEDPGSELFQLLGSDAKPNKLFYSQGRAPADGNGSASGNNLDGHPAPRVLSTGVSSADTDAALAGLRGTVDLDNVLIVDTRDDLNGRDGRPAQSHYHARDWEGIHTAEGFVDPHNGQIVLLRRNIQVREGETPALAAARVILHERVGHLGINAVLDADPRLKDRWAQLSASIPPADLASLRQRYPHLPADSPGLALEWLAHQTGDRLASGSLQPGTLPAQMWQTLRDWVARTFHTLSGGRLMTNDALDAHVRELIHAAQKHSRPGSAGLKSNQVGLQFSQPTSNESHNPVRSKLDRSQGIPYDTQHGDSPAGRDAEAALAELRARARQRADARGSTRTDEAEWLDSEAKSLVSWAQERGWLIHGEDFTRLTAQLEQLEGGVEREVFYEAGSGRVIKSTLPPFFGQQGDLASYLNNIAWSNALFGDDIRFEGVIETDKGPAIIVSQPFIDGKKPSKRRVRRWFESQGYRPNGYNKWHHPDTGAIIADAHQANFVVVDRKHVVPIDLQVLNPGNKILSEEERDY